MKKLILMILVFIIMSSIVFAECIDWDSDGSFAPSPSCPEGNDCNDYNESVYPGATEIPANGVDENCDTEELCYEDMDGDNYGSTSTVISNDPFCTDPGESSNSEDCGDYDPLVYPGATEIIGNSVDDNCDGKELCYKDADDDGYRPDGVSTVLSDDLDCDDSGEAQSADPISDCDDGDGSVYPGATEICDGIDNDCDLDVDEGVITTYYLDSDGDGFGSFSPTIQACTQPANYSVNSNDCDDGDGSVYPGATEIPANGVDEDCDTEELCYEDMDGDNYGSTSTVISVDPFCTDPGESSNSEDCGDYDPLVYPGATETCNGVDDNCDGIVDNDPSCPPVALTAPAGATFVDGNGDPITGAVPGSEVYLRIGGTDSVKLQVTGVIDLTGVVADTDGATSLLHFGGGSRSGIGTVELIFSRSGAEESVRICPGATILAEVFDSCIGEIILNSDIPSSGGYTLVELSDLIYWHVQADASIFSTGGEEVPSGPEGPGPEVIPEFSTFGMVVMLLFLTIGGFFYLRDKKKN